ncbi:bacteriophage CI repressor [Agrobacterium rhizogenes]|nr:bacteriophage CI repressor [Rhizobium rhizogenes]
MMEEPIRVYIERLKAALGVTTDEEAASNLGISKQAIANWRRRGNVPLEVEIRLVNSFGPDFARSEIAKDVSVLRENEVVYAAALHAYFKIAERLGGKPTFEQLRSMGYLFKDIEENIRKKVREISFENENSSTLLEIMIALLDAGKMPLVSDSLAPFGVERP